VFGRFLLVLAVALALWALFARDTTASGSPARYHVRAGDTLWSIATRHFAGDPREGVWELRQRNRLQGVTIRPGQVLVLP
jgi:LysM repeat protein